MVGQPLMVRITSAKRPIKESILCEIFKAGALSVAGGILPSVRALQIPSPGWERTKVRGIKDRFGFFSVDNRIFSD